MAAFMSTPRIMAVFFVLYIFHFFTFAFRNAMRAVCVRGQENVNPDVVIDPMHFDLRWAGLWLAAHKYFDVDRRRGNPRSWKYEIRVFHKHFPMPRLKRLHPEAKAACEQGVVECVRQVAAMAKDSYSLAPLMKEDGYTHEDEIEKAESEPFKDSLELFQYRTTASYFMCWYTMQEMEVLRNFMGGKNCLHRLHQVKEHEWAGIDVVDFRNDTPFYPFQCAEILFCPDPCFGRQTEGTVSSEKALARDKGNPCKELKDKSCKWNREENVDFESLQRNRFNITCKCKKEYPGFEWNSKFGLCVDINECNDEKTKCPHGKLCQNKPGSYTCLCRRGQIFDEKQEKCVEHVPLPAHSYSRPRKIKAKRPNDRALKAPYLSSGHLSNDRRRRVVL